MTDDREVTTFDGSVMRVALDDSNKARVQITVHGDTGEGATLRLMAEDSKDLPFMARLRITVERIDG
jgi:hypothetical protein